MADDVMGKAAAEAKPSLPAALGNGSPTASAESRADRARRLAYRRRFGVLYVLLAVVAGAGVGAFLVLVGRGGPEPAPAWSRWEPTGSTQRRAAQIADHVTTPYRLPSGNQLAAATYSGPPLGQGPDGTFQEVRAVAVLPDTTAGRAEADDIATVDARGTIMYTLCGLGAGCSIREGEPTVERGQLLRREALELALYSFTYLEGVDSVLVLLPPRPDGKVATAVFLERSDVRGELGRPLAETLPASTAPGIGQISVDEMRVVDHATLDRLYTYRYLQAQDGSPVLVLAPAVGG